MAVMYKVWCEYDLDWNIDEHIGVYRTKAKMESDLKKKDWEDLGYDSWQDARDNGMLDIEKIEVE